MDNNKKYLDRWEEKEFLTDWVKHAPAGSLDKSVDDILAELGFGDNSTPAQPTAQPRPAQPTAQPRPAQPTAQPRPAQPTAQPRPAQPTAQPRPAQPTAQPRPAQPTAQPRPAQPTAQPRPAQPTAQPRPAQPTAQPRPAQPAEQQKPTSPAIPVARPTITPAQKPLTPYAKPTAKPTVQPMQQQKPTAKPTAQPVQQQKPTAQPVQQQKPTTKPQPEQSVQQQKPTTPVALKKDEKPATPVTPKKDEKTAPATTPRKKKPKDKWIWRFLGNILPKKGDGFFELLRKGVCICAIFVLVGSSCVLLNDFVFTPLSGSTTISHVSDMRKKPIDPNEDASIYPAGILDSFKNLYKQNSDTIGWITYESTSPYWHEKLANPGYVVTQTRDNDYYLHRDFNKNDDRNGTIYMDYRCDYSTKEAAEKARVTILYGHNMYSGLMFANVNKLLDSLAFAQSAPVINFSSLYSENKYKVFAIISHDSMEEGAYNFLQTDFSSDEQFLEYVAEARLRSWYNYNAVNVRADDQILILFTCSNTYQTTMGKEGRTLLMARKVRPDESADVDISTITENTGKLMPRQWYTNNSLNLPEYYNSQDAAKKAVQNAMQ